MSRDFGVRRWWRDALNPKGEPRIGVAYVDSDNNHSNPGAAPFDESNVAKEWAKTIGFA
jgi:hypothetical protein